MRFFIRPLFLSLALVSSFVTAQDFDAPGVAKEKHSYQVSQALSLTQPAVDWLSRVMLRV
jgi:hypothetical protein